MPERHVALPGRAAGEGRYPFAPVDALRGDTEISVLADKIGVAHSTIGKWRERGMEEHNADAVATALGLHPWQLWPEMLAVNTAAIMKECERPGCLEEFVPTRKGHRFCSERCRRQARRKRERSKQRERYRNDPEVRARKIAQSRAYRAEVARALAVSRRAKYRANADELRAKRRARYAANADAEKARQAAYRARLREEGAA